MVVLFSHVTVCVLATSGVIFLRRYRKELNDSSSRLHMFWLQRHPMFLSYMKWSSLVIIAGLVMIIVNSLVSIAEILLT